MLHTASYFEIHRPDRHRRHRLCISGRHRIRRIRSGNSFAGEATQSSRCRPIAGTSMRSTIRCPGAGQDGLPGAPACCTTSPRSMPASSESRRAKRRRWIRSSDCCSKSLGVRSKMRAFPPKAWPASNTGVYIGISHSDYHVDPAFRPATDRRSHRLRRRTQHCGQPIVAPFRSARAEPRGRYRVLVVAGGARRGLHGPADRRMRSHPGRRRERHAHAGRHHHLQPSYACCRRTAAARRSMRARTAMCAAKAPASWSSSSCRARCSIATASTR